MTSHRCKRIFKINDSGTMSVFVYSRHLFIFFVIIKVYCLLALKVTRVRVEMFVY